MDRVRVLLGAGAMAFLFGFGVAHAQATGHSVYSDRPMSADELERAFGLGTAKPAARAVTRSIASRSVSIELGTAEDNRGAEQGTQASPVATSISVPVQFVVGSDNVDPHWRKGLTGVSEMMRRNNNLIMLVIGHTDSRGSPAMNQRLSERRALAVRQVLISQGVNESQIAAMGQGATRPLEDELATGDRQRRVEFVPVRVE